MEIWMDSSVLFVSPYVQDASSLAEMLDEVSIPVVHASSLKDAVSKLRAASFGVVLTEAKLDDGNWLDLLELTRRSGTELIVTDAWADAQFWAMAINLGAYDMLAQPFRGTEVRRVLASASSRQTSAKTAGVI
jgi:DNA-binding NtrC family response regulator